MKIEGRVVRGRQLGRTLGFPTANLQPERIEGTGPDGVYAAWFFVNGLRLPCILNIGSHPTLPGGGRSVEAHILGYAGDLYGCRASVETVAFLRGEVKFSSPEALRMQLTRDAKRSQELLDGATDGKPWRDT